MRPPGCRRWRHSKSTLSSSSPLSTGWTPIPVPPEVASRRSSAAAGRPCLGRLAGRAVLVRLGTQVQYARQILTAELLGAILGGRHPSSASNRQEPIALRGPSSASLKLDMWRYCADCLAEMRISARTTNPRFNPPAQPSARAQCQVPPAHLVQNPTKRLPSRLARGLPTRLSI
jgi:hypothetical protein